MLEFEKIFKHINQDLGSAIIRKTESATFNAIEVHLEQLEKVLRFCQSDEELGFDLLECLSGIDTSQDFILLYQLFSTKHLHRLNVKSFVGRYNPKAPSIKDIWNAAGYYEQETSEMFGILFGDDKEIEHLFLPTDWQGFPLRKDYIYPEEFGGLEHRRAPLRKDHPRP